MTMMMSYFETDDKAVLSVFCGSIGLVVFFWFLTKSVATAAPEWIAPLVILSLAAVYMIPTMRRMVVLIEDVDEISALFERTWREHENDEKKGPAPAEVAGALSQPTADLRRLYVLARARRRLQVDVVECLARAGRTPAESSRETRGPQLKGLLRAREKIAMDYDGDASHLRDILRASIVCETVEELRTLGDELAALETAGTVRVVQVKNRFVGDAFHALHGLGQLPSQSWPSRTSSTSPSSSAGAGSWGPGEAHRGDARVEPPLRGATSRRETSVRGSSSSCSKAPTRWYTVIRPASVQPGAGGAY